MTRRGSAPKPSRVLDRTVVAYIPAHWSVLHDLRTEALTVLDGLGSWKDEAIVHGSLARGDIDENSDIDVVLPAVVSTQLVEVGLQAAGFEIFSREIAQATPMHSPKAHVYLDLEQKKAVTVPLSPFRKLEMEFYRFGGTVTRQDLRDEKRKPGCTKKLTLIEPTAQGHIESSILECEPEVAKILDVSVDIVRERVRVLTRRDTIGRTGIFLKLSVPEGASFEEALEEEAKSNPALRRTLRKRKMHA